MVHGDLCAKSVQCMTSGEPNVSDAVSQLNSPKSKNHARATDAREPVEPVPSTWKAVLAIPIDFHMAIRSSHSPESSNCNLIALFETSRVLLDSGAMSNSLQRLVMLRATKGLGLSQKALASLV